MEANVRHILKATVGAVLLLPTACTTTVNTVERAEPIGRRQYVDDRRIQTDPGLARKVGVVGVNQATLPDGLLKVQIEVTNRTRSAQNFQYKFEWFDQAGMLVHTPMSTWVERQINGGETISITAIAPRETAKDFRIKFIEK